tara:strand:- start:1321 stop:2241 length:921 start_codon:yes stop_codon:yes gene_type:complete
MSNYSKNIWFNGEVIPFNKAKVHILSHCIHYGTGVFEGIKCYNTPKGPAVFKLTEHMKRLHKSANNYKMTIPYSVKELCDGTIKLIKDNELNNCYIRPIAYYGYDTLGVHPKDCPVEVAIGTLDWGAYVGKEALKKGAKVTISPWKKYQSKSFPASTKSSGTYLNSLLAVQDAKSRGFDEALLLNLDDTIAEGSGQNFFLVKDGIFHTNDKNANILMGITRDTVLNLINDLGMDYKIADITQEDLFNADEAFFTGSASEVTPIRKIDNHIFSGGKAGKLTLEIQELYYNIVRGENKKYDSWLTYIN